MRASSGASRFKNAERFGCRSFKSIWYRIPLLFFVSHYANVSGRVCCKVADFGLTKELITANFKGMSAAHRDVSNPTWLSPEILSGLESGLESDVYAYAIILWELVTRKHPFYHKDALIDIELCVIDGERPIEEPYPSVLLEKLVRYVLSVYVQHFFDFARSSWEQSKSERPKFSTIVDKLLPPIISELTPELHKNLQQIEKDINLSVC
jgi:hypothetical protein